jgi:hypothetical protein
LSFTGVFSAFSTGALGASPLTGTERAVCGGARLRGVATGGLVLFAGSLGVEGLMAEAAT